MHKSFSIVSLLLAVVAIYTFDLEEKIFPIEFSRISLPTEVALNSLELEWANHENILLLDKFAGKNSPALYLPSDFIPSESKPILSLERFSSPRLYERPYSGATHFFHAVDY